MFSFLIKIKKTLGSLGRRYGGKPFQMVRKFIYDSMEIPDQLRKVRQVRCRKLSADTENGILYNQHYHQELPVNPDASPGIIFFCDGKVLHGGLTDRIRGILTTYREAKRRGIPFYIYWREPFTLEDYLMPATFDWRLSSGKISYSPQDAMPVVIWETNLWQSHMVNSLLLKAALHKPCLQTHVYSNADNAFNDYSNLYADLFRPSPALVREVERHSSILGEHYYAFSFRFLQLLGDFKDGPQKVLSLPEREALIRKAGNELVKMLGDIPSDRRVLVAGDSHTFLSYAEKLDPRIYVVPGEIRHTDFEPGQYNDAWMKTFVDQALLMNAERVILMRTEGMYRSGFPRFAAKVGGKPFIDHQF